MSVGQSVGRSVGPLVAISLFQCLRALFFALQLLRQPETLEKLNSELLLFLRFFLNFL